MKNLNQLNESIRQQLINLENIRSDLTALKQSNKAEGKLKERLNLYLSTAIADLFICYEFISEAESCIDEADLEFLLEVSGECFGEEIN